MFDKINSRLISQALLLIISVSILFTTRNASAIGTGQTDFGEIDRFIQESMRVQRIPGLALAVVQGDQIVHMQGYGYAGPEREMTTDTPMYIGSLSKSITALAIMQLVEQGDIQLDDPVQDYLPWFRVADPVASKAITVRNLLNHTSGLSEWGYFPDLSEDATLRTAVEELSRARPIERAGAKYHYFNENYDILGLLVETISGVPYGQYVQENIFAPLEMEDSFADPRQAERAGVAQGHGVLFGFPIPREEAHPVYSTPSGHIVSTAKDMAHLLILQLNGGRYAGKQVLSEAGTEAMHTPPEGIGSDYAMGWKELQFNGMTALNHEGMIMNFTAFAWLLPNLDTGVVVLSNQTGLLYSMMAMPELARGILNILVQEPATAGMSMSIIDSILAVVILVFIGLQARWWLVKLPMWKVKVTQKSRLVQTIDILKEFVWALVLYFGIPYLFLLQSEKRLSWERGFGLAPALYAWLILTIINGIAKGLTKAWVVYSAFLSRASLSTGIQEENVETVL